MQRETTMGGGASAFPQTRWTLIRASREGLESRRLALEELLAAYWKPLYFFVRRKGLSVECAKDAVQGFFLHLMEGDVFSRLDGGKGSFRAYLRTAMSHYLANLYESQSAQKRGGGIKIVALDFEAAERDVAETAASPEAAFDREWALSVMERSLGRLRQEFDSGIRSGPFHIFEKSFRLGETPSYDTAAAECSMSVVQFKAFLHRTRVRFRDLVRQEVSQTVTDEREAEAEIAELFKALSA